MLSMLRDDCVITHKSDDCESDHIDNKHHLRGLPAGVHFCIVLARAMRGCYLKHRVCICCRIVKLCSCLSARSNPLQIYHVRRYSSCPLALAPGVYLTTSRGGIYYSGHRICLALYCRVYG
jgi:hypothetical protein